jgi:hypothetical protein
VFLAPFKSDFMFFVSIDVRFKGSIKVSHSFVKSKLNL